MVKSKRDELYDIIRVVIEFFLKNEIFSFVEQTAPTKLSRSPCKIRDAVRKPQIVKFC